MKTLLYKCDVEDAANVETKSISCNATGLQAMRQENTEEMDA